MTFPSPNKLFGILTIAILPGCAVPGSRGHGSSPEGERTRWIVVERLVGDYSGEGAWSEGQLQPEAAILVMTAVRDAPASWTPMIHTADYYVEVTAITPKGQVEVGQVVTLSVRVGNAQPNAIYKLKAFPRGIGTQILGSAEVVLAGRELAEIRFTRVAEGVGTIGVEVEALR